MASSAVSSPLPTTVSPVTASAPTAREELAALVRLALPIAFAQLVLMATTLVEVAVVGHQGVAQLAGVSLGRSVGFSSMTVTMGVAFALEPLAAQAIGAREPERAFAALKATLRSVTLVWSLSALVASALVFALGPLGVDPLALPHARAFLFTQLPGLLLYNMFLSAKTFLQAHGKTRPIVVAAIVANVMNFFVCNLAVRGDGALAAVGLPPVGLPAFGAAGAGVAFSLSVGTLAGICLFSCWQLRPVAAVLRAESSPQVKPVTVSAVLRLGVPIGLQILTEAGVFALVALLAGKLGAHVLSAHQVALALASTTYMVAVGISGATAVRVGRAVGEKRSPQQAGWLGIGLGATWMLLCATCFALFPRLLVGIFTSDPQVIELGVSLLRIAAFFQLFDGLQTVTLGALRGVGDVRLPFVFAIIAYWVIGLPLSLVLGFGLHLGAVGFWWGLTLGLVVAALLLTLRFRVVVRRPVARVE
jgi:MATE family multidrug resistance protein